MKIYIYFYEITITNINTNFQQDLPTNIKNIKLFFLKIYIFLTMYYSQILVGNQRIFYQRQSKSGRGQNNQAWINKYKPILKQTNDVQRTDVIGYWNKGGREEKQNMTMMIQKMGSERKSENAPGATKLLMVEKKATMD